MLLTHLLESTIVDQLENNIPSQLNAVVANLPTFRRIWKNVYLSFPLRSPPKVDASGVQLSVPLVPSVGTWDNSMMRCPDLQNPVSTPPVYRSKKMVSVAVTEPGNIIATTLCE